MPSTADLQPGLCVTPNQHTRPSGRTLRPGAVDLFGYQEFSATADDLVVAPVDGALARKSALLQGVFQPSILSGRTVLDLGANNGYFSLLALQRGAAQATAVDLDPQCIANLEAARDHLSLRALDVCGANAAEWSRPADCVLALALSHWLGACTAALGSLDAVVGHLADLAGYLVVLEYVDANDPAVETFGHLSWKGQSVSDYSRDAFEAALRRRCRRVVRLGDQTPTRSLYVAFKTDWDIDLRFPHAFMFPPAQLISCRQLTAGDGGNRWSAVFDLGDAIVKQTTGTLALHEAAVLSCLSTAATPRVLSTRTSDDCSAVVIERIAGVPLSRAGAELAADRPAFVRFVRGCFDLLDALRGAGIVHRDIHEANVLVRDGLPVLIDFGWATAPGFDIDAPPAIRAWRLAVREADATHEHCDIRGFGRMLADVSAGRHPDLAALFGLMAEPVASLRVIDTAALREQLDTIERAAAGAVGPDAMLVRLLLLAEARRRRATEQQVRAEHAATALGERDAAHAAERQDADARHADHRRRLVLAAIDRHAELHARLSDAIASQGTLGPLTADDGRYLAAYAKQLRSRGDQQRAYEVAACALRSIDVEHSSWALLTYMCGSIEAAEGRQEAALVSFRQVMCDGTGAESKPYVGGAAFHVARILAETGRVRQARPYVERCLELLPDHGEAARLAERLANDTAADWR